MTRKSAGVGQDKSRTGVRTDCQIAHRDKQCLKSRGEPEIATGDAKTDQELTSKFRAGPELTTRVG